MLILISYDLDQPGRSDAYEAVRERIVGAAAEVRRTMHSQWLVVSDDGLDTWVERLRDLLTPADRLLVTRISGPVNGWLPREHWDWINEHA